jgi:hypothetical protein
MVAPGGGTSIRSATVPTTNFLWTELGSNPGALRLGLTDYPSKQGCPSSYRSAATCRTAFLFFLILSCVVLDQEKTTRQAMCV